jgi:hypothetical protein
MLSFLTEEDGSLLIAAGHVHHALAVVGSTDINPRRLAAVERVAQRQLSVRVLDQRNAPRIHFPVYIMRAIGAQQTCLRT